MQSPSGISPAVSSTSTKSDDNLLSSTALLSPPSQSAVLASNASEVTHHPSNFKARREALNLTTAQLARLLGLSSSDVEVIETVSLGDEVAFLHNFALSALELGAIEPVDV